MIQIENQLTGILVPLFINSVLKYIKYAFAHYEWIISIQKQTISTILGFPVALMKIPSGHYKGNK